MEKREDVLEFLVEKIEEMKKEHVADLMRANRVEELEAIAETIDLSEIDEYIQEGDYLNLKLEEIPADSLLETVFVLNNSKREDYEIWEDWQYVARVLEDSGRELECIIADLMRFDDLCNFTLEVLLSGEIPEEDDDDCDDEPEEE